MRLEYHSYQGNYLDYDRVLFQKYSIVFSWHITVISFETCEYKCKVRNYQGANLKSVNIYHNVFSSWWKIKVARI